MCNGCILRIGGGEAAFWYEGSNEGDVNNTERADMGFD